MISQKCGEMLHSGVINLTYGCDSYHLGKAFGSPTFAALKRLLNTQPKPLSTVRLINTTIMENKTHESFSISGESLVKKVKELIAEGNIRKISISDKSGKELMSFPLTFGLVGAVIAPVLAALGAMAALIGECTITVEREAAGE